jgi:hypothetical protein
MRALLLSDLDSGASISEVRLLTPYFGHTYSPPPLKTVTTRSTAEDGTSEQGIYQASFIRVERILIDAIFWQDQHRAERVGPILGQGGLAELKETVESLRSREGLSGAEFGELLRVLQELYESKDSTPGDSVDSGGKMLGLDEADDTAFLRPIREACEKLNVPFVLPNAARRAHLGIPSPSAESDFVVGEEDCNEDGTKELMLSVSTSFSSSPLMGLLLSCR